MIIYVVPLDHYYHIIPFKLKKIWRYIKVTVHLQGCLSSKRCSAPGLNGRYLKPYIKLKLIELAI